MDQSTPLPRRTRRHVAVAILVSLLVIAVPAIVVATHQFSDVPTDSTFHDEIEALYDARIATGCATGLYCPNNAVTRAQMAGFMGRGLGHAAASTGQITASEAAELYVAAVELPAGQVSGGTVYVEATANVNLLDFNGTCPCVAVVFLQDVESGAMSPPMYLLAGSETVQGGTTDSATVSWVFEVPSGTLRTIGVAADVFYDVVEPLGGSGGGTQGVDLEPQLVANITAEYVPFGSTILFEPAEVTGVGVPAQWAPRGDVVRQVPTD